jgi:hypothetical protein
MERHIETCSRQTGWRRTVRVIKGAYGGLLGGGEILLKQPDNPDRQRREVRILGILGLLVAVLFGALYLMNLRSRLRYHGPDWSFLGWIAAYLTVTGIGLLMLRKWALLLSFLPAFAILVPFVIAWHRNRSLTMPAILLEVCQIGILIIVPGILLRSWRLLKW